ncbi:LacI family transcriptional regulator [Bacillus sp. NPDC077027]|uniref:LacI family transcriptional regulator n=1 Tax=Bacillus sp. NPDC077027 TaxID=3390548 RepID=UPI003D051565
MMKGKIKKIVGAVVFTGALLFSSGLPADAAPNLIPIRDKHKTGYQFDWNGYENGVGKVTVWFRDSNGKSYHEVYYCVTVINSTCYVYE